MIIALLYMFDYQARPRLQPIATELDEDNDSILEYVPTDVSMTPLMNRGYTEIETNFVEFLM